LSWIAEYLFERGVEDVEIWKLLQEEQVRTYNRRLKKLERALGEERKNARQRRAKPAVSSTETTHEPTASNKLSYETWKTMKRVVGRLRARASRR
jgi:hypothetical protein